MSLPPRRSCRSAGAAATFTAGAPVEVCLNEPGFQGAWFEATVAKPLPKSQSYTVVFATLVSDDDPSSPLRETVRAPNIRPRPPRFAADDRYAPDELVDVFYNDGWWLGVVCRAYGGDPPSLYSVCFPVRREEAEYGPSQMRPHLEWKDGQWCPSSLAGARFEVGEEVEVDGDRETSELYRTAWLTGTVAKVIDESTFSVEYLKPIEGGTQNLSVEILDAQYLRPVPPQTPKSRVFALLEEVEVCCCGGWMGGVVSGLVDGSNYIVKLKYGKGEEMDVNRKDMRIHYNWINGQWKCSTKGRGRPSLGAKTPSSSSSSGPSLKREMEVGVHSEGQVEALYPRKERKLRDMSDLLSSKIEPRTPAVEIEFSDAVKDFQSPPNDTVKPRTPALEIEFSDAVKDFQSPPNDTVMPNGDKEMAHVSDSAQNARPSMKIPFVKSSFLWNSIKSMPVFELMPQEPCFRQLEKLSEEIREGTAIGLMVTFDNLVTSVGKLCISDSQATFDEKLKSLVPLEENGFDVCRVRLRIEKLLEIKNYHRHSKNQKITLEEQKFRKEYEEFRLETLNCALDKSIMEMEHHLASVRKERDSVYMQRMTTSSEIAKLQKDVQSADDAYLSAEQHFTSILTSQW